MCNPLSVGCSCWECRCLVPCATSSNRRAPESGGGSPGSRALGIGTVAAVVRQSTSLGTCTFGEIYTASYFCWCPLTSAQTRSLGCYPLTGSLQILCWRHKRALHDFTCFSQTVLTGTRLLQAGSELFCLLGILGKTKSHNLTPNAPSIKYPPSALWKMHICN